MFKCNQNVPIDGFNGLEPNLGDCVVNIGIAINNMFNTNYYVEKQKPKATKRLLPINKRKQKPITYSSMFFLDKSKPSKKLSLRQPEWLFE